MNFCIFAKVATKLMMLINLSDFLLLSDRATYSVARTASGLLPPIQPPLGRPTVAHGAVCPVNPCRFDPSAPPGRRCAASAPQVRPEEAHSSEKTGEAE